MGKKPIMNSPKAAKNNGELPMKAEPAWAAGLSHLYNSVVEEELPDSFKALLKKLDESSDD